MQSSKLAITPGPWVASGFYVIAPTAISAINKPMQICATAYLGYKDREPDFNAEKAEREANTNLMAAAPDLYEALELLLEEQNSCPDGAVASYWETAVTKANAALAKARGEVANG